MEKFDGDMQAHTVLQNELAFRVHKLLVKKMKGDDSPVIDDKATRDRAFIEWVQEDDKKHSFAGSYRDILSEYEKELRKEGTPFDIYNVSEEGKEKLAARIFAHYPTVH